MFALLINRHFTFKTQSPLTFQTLRAKLATILQNITPLTTSTGINQTIHRHRGNTDEALAMRGTQSQLGMKKAMSTSIAVTCNVFPQDPCRTARSIQAHWRKPEAIPSLRPPIWDGEIELNSPTSSKLF